jgi:hypothetical protein
MTQTPIVPEGSLGQGEPEVKSVIAAHEWVQNVGDVGVMGADSQTVSEGHTSVVVQIAKRFTVPPPLHAPTASAMSVPIEMLA